MNPYYVLAFYHFTSIENPFEEVKRHKEFFENKDITSRIYISEDGINGQMSATETASKEYKDWMLARKEFKDVHFKVHQWHEHAFPRKTVKYRKKLVAYDERVNLALRGDHVTPAQWKEMLESENDYLLIDVRNDYEWELGHFKGASLPACKTFREFEDYAENLKQEKDPEKTPVMMYCTGGIRCELYSSILKEKGFKNVYQLLGGIINYGLEEGSKHWLGKLFVFDDRLSIPISEEEAPVIGKCHICGDTSESYYNCANMDCNHLFLCCKNCLESLAGCCKKECQQAPRLRPYHSQNPHKPFRKKYHYDMAENPDN
jgi:UPF0176 protein